MKLKVSRILHAGYLFEYKDTQIAFDPIFENPFSRNCYAYPPVQFDTSAIKKLKLSAVFISHYHDDHCSLESLQLLDRETPIYLFCVHPELFAWIRELGFHKVYSLKIDEPVFVNDFCVAAKMALDADVDSIFHIQVMGLNILNVVDSWIDPKTFQQLTEVANWDLVMWPFQTMRELEVLAPSWVSESKVELPIEWLEQLKILKPRNLVPSSCQFIHESWSWYNHALFPITYTQFAKVISDILPETRIVRMNPSVSIYLDQNEVSSAEPLSWIHPIGNQDVDYEYIPNLVPPKTCDIAKHFSALSFAQKKLVISYCEKELLEVYRELEPSQEEYFQNPRIWQLSLYDQLGQESAFFYRIEKNKIETILTASNERQIEWKTEIPIAKLYAALCLGESLTSMYLRINDHIFSEQIKSQIQKVDLIEDPLVRCLFNGKFGTYQKAQLDRILNQEKNIKN